MHQALKQRVTLLDIAADAGVSRATVSLVIRNVPSVADATRKRVQRSIKRLGYIYHRGAASLRMQQSHAIGLIVSDITNPFFAEVIVAIEERLATARLVTLLGNTSEDHAKEERLLKTMREFPADGILICPAIGRGDSSEAVTLAGQMPTVAFARRPPGLDYAGVDNAQGSLLAVEHLCQLGNRRIAFIGGDPESQRVRSALKDISGPWTDSVYHLILGWCFLPLRRAEEAMIACNDCCKWRIAQPQLSVSTTSLRSGSSKLFNRQACEREENSGWWDSTMSLTRRKAFQD